MAKFASNSDNKRELTESEIEQGFGVCGSEGMPVDSENLNGAFASVEKYAEDLIDKESKKIDGNTSEKVKQLTKLVESLRLPIGAIFETTVNYKNGKEVAKALGYGEWERYAEGMTTVGISTESTAPSWTKSMGSTKGEYEHKLTINEMPRHRHDWKYGREGDDDDTGGSNDEFTYQKVNNNINTDYPIDYTGGDQAHNNVQPSIVVGKWVRTA